MRGFGVYFDSDFSNIVVNGAQSSPNAVVASPTPINTGDGLPNSNAIIASHLPGPQSPLSNVNSTVVNNLVNPGTPISTTSASSANCPTVSS